MGKREGICKEISGESGIWGHLEIGCFSKDLLLRSGEQDRHLPQDTCSPLMFSAILSRDWGLSGLLEPANLSPIPTPPVSSPLSTPYSFPHIFCTILEEMEVTVSEKLLLANAVGIGDGSHKWEVTAVLQAVGIRNKQNYITKKTEKMGKVPNSSTWNELEESSCPTFL